MIDTCVCSCGYMERAHWNDRRSKSNSCAVGGGRDWVGRVWGRLLPRQCVCGIAVPVHRYANESSTPLCKAFVSPPRWSGSTSVEFIGVCMPVCVCVCACSTHFVCYWIRWESVVVDWSFSMVDWHCLKAVFDIDTLSSGDFLRSIRRVNKRCTGAFHDRMN